MRIGPGQDVEQEADVVRRALMCLVLLAGLLGVPAMSPAQDLSGRWYGQGETSGGFLEWMFDLLPDGNFIIEFRAYRECRVVFRQVESGQWSLENGILATISDLINGKAQYSYKSYELQTVRDAEIEYQHRESGRFFRSRRVPADMPWPACDPDKVSWRRHAGPAAA